MTDPLVPGRFGITGDARMHYAKAVGREVLCGAGPAMQVQDWGRMCAECNIAMFHTAVIRGEAPK